MNINVNSIYQAKLNEIQSRIPNISEKTANFSEFLKTATESNNPSATTENIPTEQTTNNTNNNNNADSLALLSLLSTNSMYNTSSLFSTDSSNNNSTLSNLNTLLALQQYNK